MNRLAIVYARRYANHYVVVGTDSQDSIHYTPTTYYVGILTPTGVTLKADLYAPIPVVIEDAASPIKYLKIYSWDIDGYILLGPFTYHLHNCHHYPLDRPIPSSQIVPNDLYLYLQKQMAQMTPKQRSWCTLL